MDSAAIANIVSGVINAALGLQNGVQVTPTRDDGNPRAQQPNSGSTGGVIGIHSSRLEDKGT